LFHIGIIAIIGSRSAAPGTWIQDFGS